MSLRRSLSTPLLNMLGKHRRNSWHMMLPKLTGNAGAAAVGSRRHVSLFRIVNLVLLFALVNVGLNLMHLSQFSKSHGIRVMGDWSRELRELTSDVDTSMPSSQASSSPSSSPGRCSIRKSLTPARSANLNAPWQVYNEGDASSTSGSQLGKIWVYSAVYDDREAPAVRLITLLDRPYENYTKPLRCLVWYGNGEEDYAIKNVSEVIYPRGTFEKPRHNSANSYLLSCQLDSNKIPEAVSLVNTQQISSCQPIFNYSPIENVDQDFDPTIKTGGDIAVCVRPLIFSDSKMVPRLAEWLELLSLFKVDQVFFYHYRVNRAILDLMEHFDKRNHFVDLKQFNQPDHQLQHKMFEDMTRVVDDENILRLQGDIIAFLHCYYRNIYKFRFVAYMDVDEMIVPVMHNDWVSMLDQLEPTFPQETTSYLFLNTYFFEDLPSLNNSIIPSYMHMLRYPTRSNLHLNYLPKSIHRTDSVMTVRSHVASHCLREDRKCFNQRVSPQVAYLAHFRNNCQKQVDWLCNKMRSHLKKELRLLQFGEIIVNRTEADLEAIKYFDQQNKK